MDRNGWEVSLQGGLENCSASKQFLHHPSLSNRSRKQFHSLNLRIDEREQLIGFNNFQGISRIGTNQ